jgi:hypothetical protein
MMSRRLHAKTVAQLVASRGIMLNFLICALLLFLISPADARTFRGP